jgi:hypothetical protein
MGAVDRRGTDGQRVAVTPGDGAAVTGEQALELKATEAAHFLLFDLK